MDVVRIWKLDYCIWHTKIPHIVYTNNFLNEMVTRKWSVWLLSYGVDTTDEPIRDD
jgi:hypothetical protein